jgi:hypothetical protein
MKNLSDHTDLPSLLIKGIQMGEMFKLDWLIRLVKHVTWADSLCFLHLLLISISKILASSLPSLQPSTQTNSVLK